MIPKIAHQKWHKQKKIITLIIAIFILSSTMVFAAYTDGAKVENQLLNQNPDPVEPGQYVELRWKLENNGGEPTKNILFELEPKYPFSLDPGIEHIQRLGKLDSYQVGDDAYVIYYKVKVDKKAVDGNYDIDYRFSTNNGDTWREDSDSIRIEDNEYNIVLNDITTNPTKVSPGQEVKLSLNVKNLASSQISNILVSLNLANAASQVELPFTPVGSSDSVVINSIDAGESGKVNFKLAVNANAESKVHKIPVTVSFTNNQGTSFTKTFIVGVTVFEKPDYLINLESTEIYKNKQKGKIITSISNTGMSQINFLTITLLKSEDYKIIGPDKIYIGNLNSDDFETADFEIYMNSDKTKVPYKVKLDYKDEFNNQFSDEKTLTLNLYSNDEALKYGFKSPKNYTGTIISVLIILGLGFWYWRRKVKKGKK